MKHENSAPQEKLQRKKKKIAQMAPVIRNTPVLPDCDRYINKVVLTCSNKNINVPGKQPHGRKKNRCRPQTTTRTKTTRAVLCTCQSELD